MKNFLKIALFLVFSFNANAADICTKYNGDLKTDQEYRVVFGDSGVGGLIFALDVAQELETKLKALETEYKVSFTFNHFGDSKNAPYGSREPQDIRNLTKKFLEHLLNLPNTHSAVSACNTASTAYDAKTQEFFSSKYPNIKIITMIDESAKELVKAASDDGKISHPTIAFMATPATLKSRAYNDKIEQLTVENRAKLYDYAPQSWVKNIESGADKKLAESDVQKDLEIFKSQIGQDFSKVGAVGLFCTHFPFYKNQIQDFFAKNGNKNVAILTQGHIFSEKIYDDIAQNLQKLNYKKRKALLPFKCAKDVAINSEVTGNNAAQMQEVISHTHPQYYNKISFKQVNLD